MEKKVIVEMPFPADSRWKYWAKILEDVDTSLSNGYAFKGKFIPLSDPRHRNIRKVEIEVGKIIMVYEEEGSRKYHKPVITLYEVKEDGSLEVIFSHKCDGFSWALEVRDEIKKILYEKKKQKQSKEEKKKILIEQKQKLLAELQQINKELEAIEKGES
jgi:hypothetical protein